MLASGDSKQLSNQLRSTLLGVRLVNDHSHTREISHHNPQVDAEVRVLLGPFSSLLRELFCDVVGVFRTKRHKMKDRLASQPVGDPPGHFCRQTIEPRAQVILRPNEPNAGKLPNEDAQSLIFDDSNLFKVDKFAGYDRIEGGGRANVGVQYTAQFNQGGFFSALFGQSYQLFGTNSFAVADATNTGINSGLDTTRSDYVARVSYQPDRVYTFTTRFRFDERTFDIRRFEAEARANFDRWSVALLYGHYDAQPEIGYLTTRQGILGSTAIKLTPNWVLQTAARYDIDQAKFDQTRIGVGYIDDCFILALNYTTTYNYNGLPTTDHRVMMQINLRTLGGTSVSQGVGGLPGGL